VQFDFSAGSAIRGIYHAGIEWPRIHMQTDGSFIELTGVEDPVHGVGWVHGAGMGGIHLHGVGGFEFAASLFEFLRYEMIILHE
jgi:hypothetical protein